MGNYIQTLLNKNKAVQICAKNKEARIIPQPRSFADIEMKYGLICVIENEHFEAAAFCDCEKEFLEFGEPKFGDYRKRIWVIMDRRKAEIQSGFAKE